MSSITVLSQHRERQSPFRQETPYISIIIPMYNEQEVLAACHERVCSVLDQMGKHCEIIYIDDGSSDESWNIASQLGSKHHSIKTIRLSRNFGKEAAMSAGLKAVTAEAAVLIDADLQDPPELIPDMVAQWQAGFDVVDMQRRRRWGKDGLSALPLQLFIKL